jgi:hypothetical protein
MELSACNSHRADSVFYSPSVDHEIITGLNVRYWSYEYNLFLWWPFRVINCNLLADWLTHLLTVLRHSTGNAIYGRKFVTTERTKSMLTKSENNRYFGSILKTYISIIWLPDRGLRIWSAPHENEYNVITREDISILTVNFHNTINDNSIVHLLTCLTQQLVERSV